MYYTWKLQTVSTVIDILSLNFDLEGVVKIVKVNGDASRIESGAMMEIRGIVNKDMTISFGEYTRYDNEFDLATFELMTGYYHGMCKELCVRWF